MKHGDILISPGPPDGTDFDLDSKSCFCKLEMWSLTKGYTFIAPFRSLPHAAQYLLSEFPTRQSHLDPSLQSPPPAKEDCSDGYENDDDC